MRDLFVTMIVAGMLPVAFLRPVVGVFLWTWLSLMSPHRLTWGFAFDYPFVELVAITTMVGWLLNADRRLIPPTGVVVLFVAFMLWTGVTTLVALDTSIAEPRMIFVLKVFALAFFIMMTVRTREQIHALVWIVVISIGFYSAKGGLFSLLTGGEHRVWGPAGSFITNNNQLALATLMVLPLMRYLQLNSAVRLLRVAMLLLIALSILSVLMSYSRGAFIALCAMLVVFIAKSRNKLAFGSFAAVVLVLALAFAPGEWYERIASIADYQADASSVGRLEIWQFAYDVAKARPLFGGGFDVFFNEAAYARFAPDIQGRSAHSIVFQVLGEHGFVGLALFLGIGIAAWLTGSRIVRLSRNRPELHWAADLARLLQTGLVGYFVAGLFLDLAFFDLAYVFLAMMVMTGWIAQRQVSAAEGHSAVTLLPDAAPRAALGERQGAG